MTTVYHLGYRDFRSPLLVRPVAADLVWSVPTLVTLNPIGAPITHAGHARDRRPALLRDRCLPAAASLNVRRRTSCRLGLIGVFRPAAAPSRRGGDRRPSRRRRGSGRCGGCGPRRRRSACSAPAGAGAARRSCRSRRPGPAPDRAGRGRRRGRAGCPAAGARRARSARRRCRGPRGCPPCLPGVPADGQVGVAVDGRGDPSVGDGEQRLRRR